MTVSTLSMVRPACMCFMAVPAFFMASSVSLLMLAVSMEYTSRSSVMICDCVCSSECSNCFFRLSAAFAAAFGLALTDLSHFIHTFSFRMDRWIPKLTHPSYCC